MSNGLLSSNAGFGGWDTTPIQGASSHDPVTTSSNLKPYKAMDSNPFLSSASDAPAEPDQAYVNPFLDFSAPAAPQQPPQAQGPATMPAQTSPQQLESGSAIQSKAPAMGAIQEHETIDPEVF